MQIRTPMDFLLFSLCDLFILSHSVETGILVLHLAFGPTFRITRSFICNLRSVEQVQFQQGLKHNEDGEEKRGGK